MSSVNKKNERCLLDFTNIVFILLLFNQIGKICKFFDIQFM